MQKNSVKYSLIVFAGGASYGIMGTAIKSAFAAGFTWPETVAGQATSGVLLFAVALLASLAFGKRPQHLSARQALSLIALGLTTCTTCVLYNFALSKLPVAVAITLLFQFTWIGVVIEVLLTRRRPNAFELGAAGVILGGTLLASGLFEGTLTRLDPLGIACGLLSAVSCALFMFLSGRIGLGVPPLQRGLVVCLGASVLGLIVCPGYVTGAAFLGGMWAYGLVLGMFALFIPVILFGIGTPHLTPGLSTIMASSELPCGILISVLVLGEPVDALQVLGIAAILAGVVISQIPHLRPAAPDRPPWAG